MNKGFLCSLTGWLVLVACTHAETPEPATLPAEALEPATLPAAAHSEFATGRVLTENQQPSPASEPMPSVPLEPTDPERLVPVALPTEEAAAPAPGMLPPASNIPSEPLQMPAAPPSAAAEPMPIAEPRVPGQFWASAEYLLWFIPRGRLPIDLFTTGPAAISPPPGILLATGTSVLFNADELRYGTMTGVRGTAGFWFTDDRLLGMEVSGLFVQPHGFGITLPGTATATGVLARPIIDANGNRSTVALVAFPGAFNGFAEVDSSSRIVGAEVNLVGKFLQLEHREWDLFAGFRYLSLKENLDIFTSSQVLQANTLAFNGSLVPQNSVVQVLDHFGTRNEFSGGQIGVRKLDHFGNMILACTFKVAIGSNSQTVDIAGASILNPGVPGTVFVPAGIYAVASNSGRVNVQEFAVVPQVQVSVGYQCTEWLRIFVNYDCLAWTGVLRPGDQIDPVINLTQVPLSPTFGPLTGPKQPIVPLRDTVIWIQGIGLGLEMRY